MKPRQLLQALIILIGLSHLVRADVPATQPDTATAKLVALQVCRLEHEEDANGLSLSVRPGISLYFVVETPSLSILEITLPPDQISHFTDDKGTNLAVNVAAEDSACSDPDVGSIEIHSGQMLAAGAQRVQFAGILTVTYGRGNVHVANIRTSELKVGRAIQIGDASVTVVESRMEDKSQRVTFGGRDALLRVVDWQLVQSDGIQVPLPQIEETQGKVQCSMLLPSHGNHLLQIRYFHDVEKARVPVRVDTDLSLSSLADK